MFFVRFQVHVIVTSIVQLLTTLKLGLDGVRCYVTLLSMLSAKEGLML